MGLGVKVCELQSILGPGHLLAFTIWYDCRVSDGVVK